MMADDPQKVEVETELNASQTVRGAREAAAELTKVIAKAAELEKLTRAIFTGQGNLPKQLQDFTRSLQQVQALPAQLAQVQRATRNIASGGPSAALRNATVQGVISNIRTDPALQLQQIERETNRVLQARQEIYRRVRAAMPDENSAMRVSAAYRAALDAVGDMPQKGTSAYQAWIRKTRTEVQRFEQDWTKIATEEAQKRALARTRMNQATIAQELAQQSAAQKEATRLFRRDMGAIMGGATPEERRTAATQSAQRVQDNLGRRGITGVDITKLMAAYDQAEETHFLRSEARQANFQARNMRSEAESMNKRYDQDQKFWSRQERSEADRLNKQFDRDRKREVESLRAEAEFLNKRYDQDQKFWSRQERSEADRMNKQFDRDRRRNDPQLRQDRIREQVEHREAFQNYNGGANNFASRLAFTRDFAAQAALLGTFAYAATSVVDLQTKMKNLQAITQATDLELNSLQRTVLNVGNTTKFSTSEIAEAATVMAQAGYSANQIGAALPAVANLATGAGAALSDAVNIVTSVLSVYDMSIERSAQVSNMLAEALNGSKLSLEQLSLGIQYVGNISADAGVSFEEMTSALGAMANAGIKSGSTLGTGLRALIQELENPSQKFLEQLTAMGLTAADVDVRTQGLAGALQNLTAKGFDSGVAMNTFEVRAASAFSALSNNIGVMQQLEQSLQTTNAATQAAAVNMETFSAQFQRLLNAITGFTAGVGQPFLIMLQDSVGLLADLLNTSSALTPALQLLATTLLSLIAVSTVAWIGRLLVGFTHMTGVVGTLNIALVITTLRTKGFAAAVGVAAGGIRAFTAALAANPITWWTVGLTIAVEAFFAFKNAQEQSTAAMEEARTKANQARSEMESYQARMSEITQTIEMLTARHAALSTNTTLAGQAAETAQKKFGDWGLQLDANGRNVDNLIFKMVQLRAEMARLALARAQDEKQQIQAERTEIGKVNGDTMAGARLTAQGLLNQKAKGLDQVPGLTPLLQKFAQGKTSDAENLQLQQLLRSNSGKIKDSTLAGRTGPQIIVDALNSPNQLRLQQLSAREQTLNGIIGEQTVGSSGSAVRAGSSIARFTTNYADIAASISKMKPEDRAAALLQFRQQRITEFPALQAAIREEAQKQLQDPQVRSGYQLKASQQGISIEQAVYNDLTNNTGYAQLAMGAGKSTASTDPKVLQTAQQRLAAEIAAAKRTKNTALVQQLSTEKADIDKRLFAAQNPEMDPLSLQVAYENIDGKNAAGTVMGGGRSGVNRAARNTAQTAARRAKALERQIELASMSTGEPGNPATVNPELQGLLDAWKAAKVENIKMDASATGVTPDELQQRLDDFDIEATEYFAKVLQGNLEAAKKLLAEADERAATGTSSRLKSEIQQGQSNLTDGLAQVQDAWATALQSAMEASDQEFKTKGVLDPSKVGEAREARRKIQVDFVEKMVSSLNDLFAAEAQRIANDASERQRSINAGRASVAQLSNYYGSRRLGNVQRGLGEIQSQRLDEIEARSGFTVASDNYNLAVQKRDKLMQQRNATLDPGARDAFNGPLAEANQSVQEMSQALDDARNNLAQITGMAPQFASYSQAAGAAWMLIEQQMSMLPNTFETFGDGLYDAFDQGRTSLAQLVRDVATGSKSMKASIKDFSLSVLDSLMDMAAKMAANQLIGMLLNLAGSFLGGARLTASANALAANNASFQAAGINGPTYSTLGMKMGGEVPRRMAAGSPAPFRDNVLINAMPGEFLLRQSAVDMIGVDTLNQINAAGNSKISRMPTLAQAMPKREPDEVNVWVVPPESKPPIGKKDIVAAISEDIQTGGITKKLIKNVQVGG
ncbi:tape measure protein [Caulobacter phage Seuss]|uniref:Tape measure protein n=1 Tax=Caulobacter phage Seuss TaxID=1675601 RepID=A0A0K1LMW7_9CAUD|nr:tail length tape measure protein [Caulobacter phage Seuss]AKU43548.1 tape measure protein [Caulobacter phage Seuss]